LLDPALKSSDRDVRAMASFLHAMTSERRRLKESAAAANAKVRDEKRAADTQKQRADTCSRSSMPSRNSRKAFPTVLLEPLMPKQGKASLLLVDDDPDLLRLLAIRLKANGYDVTAVDSGQRALASISAARPDLVLTDLRMDGMDGMALFRKSSRRIRDCP